MNISRIIEIGFYELGIWKQGGTNSIQFESKFNLKDKKDCIYAFVIDETVYYIGKTTNSLSNRFQGYRNPGKSQNTNKGINYSIQKHLKAGQEVRVYVFEDQEHLKYGEFTINLAEGLEKSIIDSLDDKTKWNGKGLSLIEEENLDSIEYNFHKISKN